MSFLHFEVTQPTPAFKSLLDDLINITFHDRKTWLFTDLLDAHLVIIKSFLKKALKYAMNALQYMTTAFITARRKWKS